MLRFLSLSESLEKIKSSQKLLYITCLMVFFWTLFDGTVSYITPLKISQAGFSDTTLGLIIGFSSIAGGAFDFFLSKFLTNTHYRRVYLIMFALCFIYPLIIWQAKGIWLFLIAMAIWGFYFDLNNFGEYDFVGREFDHSRHSATFGLLGVFKDLGYMLAPLIAGFTLGLAASINWKPILLMVIFITISFSFYLLIRYKFKNIKKEFIEEKTYKPLHYLKELSLLRSVGYILIPPLVITMLFNIYDSFFWTLGPLLAQSYKDLFPFNGLFLTAYTLPFLFVGWFIGSITKKYGKKRTAFTGFLIGSFILAFFFLLHSPLLILSDVFLASFFVGLTLPAINGAYADYISESSRVEKEIEALSDFFTNMGYVVGPIIAGFLADRIGYLNTFYFRFNWCNCLYYLTSNYSQKN